MVGLSPSDILDENGNTLKTGLEIAGKNITIQVLNSTFPDGMTAVAPPIQDESIPATGTTMDANLRHHKYKRWNHQGKHPEKRSLAGFQSAMQHGITSTFGADEALEVLDLSLGIQFSRIDSFDAMRRSLSQLSRRLVFYTDQYPSRVTNVVENFICTVNDPDAICVIVQQVSCVVLEAGDDPSVVRFTVRNGLRDAINSGEFVEAIPAEHLPP